MDIHFHITKELFEDLPEELYEVYEYLQDGESVKMYRLRPFLAYFMADDNNKPLTNAAAMKILGKLPASKYGDVAKEFAASLSEMAVPKVSGNSSTTPDSSAAAEGFPDGSTPS